MLHHGKDIFNKKHLFWIGNTQVIDIKEFFLEYLLDLLYVACTEMPCYNYAHTVCYTYGKTHNKFINSGSSPYSRQRIETQKITDNSSIRRIIKLLQSIAYKNRQGKGKQRTYNRRTQQINTLQSLHTLNQLPKIKTHYTLLLIYIIIHIKGQSFTRWFELLKTNNRNYHPVQPVKVWRVVFSIPWFLSVGYLLPKYCINHLAYYKEQHPFILYLLCVGGSILT